MRVTDHVLEMMALSGAAARHIHVADLPAESLPQADFKDPSIVEATEPLNQPTPWLFEPHQGADQQRETDDPPRRLSCE